MGERDRDRWGPSGGLPLKEGLLILMDDRRILGRGPFGAVPEGNLWDRSMMRYASANGLAADPS